VGLSLNVTPTLSQPGKMIIILTMFVGRVSLLSILISLLPQHKSRNVHYPKDEILIN
jgi:Trk-type K+ transport system membrane component